MSSFNKKKRFNLKSMYASTIGVIALLILGACVTDNPLYGILAFIFTFVFGLFLHQSYFSPDGHNFINWILPILKLSSELIKIDGEIRENELKRIRNFLRGEFSEHRAIESFGKFKYYLTWDIDVKAVCKRINQTNKGSERLQIVHFLVKLAVVDQLLSKREEEFLYQILKEFKLPRHLLSSILRIHSFVYEENHRNTKSNPIQKAFNNDKFYAILGVKSDTSLDEVKKTYRELAKLYHPDKVRNPKLKEQAKIQFQKITEAYDSIKANNSTNK